jgi:hypothetical protein
MPGRRVGNRSDAQAKSVLHGDRAVICRPDHVYAVGARDLEAGVLEDLNGAEQIQRLAVLNCQHQDVANARHEHIFSRIPLGAKDEYPTIQATVPIGGIRG